MHFQGQGVASLYKLKGESLELIDLSALRQSGDIDLFVDCGRERTLAYLQGLGMNDLEWDYVHAHAHFFDDTEVEVHYRAGTVRNPWKNRRLQWFWKEHEGEFFGCEARLGSGSIVCPTRKMHLFYLMHHTYRHLISGGIGLRQMMDVYFSHIETFKKYQQKAMIRSPRLAKILESEIKSFEYMAAKEDERGKLADLNH